MRDADRASTLQPHGRIQGDPMKLTTVALALAFLVPAISGADVNKDKTTDKTDKTTDKKQVKKLGENEIRIVSHVHHINVMEVDLGKLAQRVGTAPVKKYAEMVTIDHQMADKSLVKFAKERGINVIPPEKPQTDADKKMMKDMQAEIAALKKLKAADFDREYLRMMVKHHDEELAMTDSLIEISTDSDLDMILQNRKASLQRHADGARELQKADSVSIKD
jgi:predicted outer membrane protein